MKRIVPILALVVFFIAPIDTEAQSAKQVTKMLNKKMKQESKGPSIPVPGLGDGDKSDGGEIPLGLLSEAF